MKIKSVRKVYWEEWVLRVLFLIAALIVIGGAAKLLRGQDTHPGVGSALPSQQTKDKPVPQPPAAPASKPATSPLDIPLTELEAKDVQLLQKDAEILTLKIQQVQQQVEAFYHFQDQQKALNDRQQALAADFSKAHNLDPAKYRLDAVKGALVPIEGKK